MTQCILSGLEIRKGCMTKEHLVPRARAPKYITNNPANIFPADKIINNIKGAYLPCEWEEIKYSLTYHALESWHIKITDREFLQRALINWEKNYKPDFCNICLLDCKEKQRE